MKLYEDLLQKIDAFDPAWIGEDQQGWRKICSAIGSLPLDDAEAILQLIYHHYLVEQGYFGAPEEKQEAIRDQLMTIAEARKNIARYPYNVQTFANTTGGKGLMFNMLNLPERLQRIIALYVLQ